MMNIVLACFSATGKIGKTAESLANKLDAQYVNIEPKIGFLKGIDSMRSFFGLKAGIKPCKTDLSDVDHLVIASSAATSTASSYIMKYISLLTNCEGKKFSIMTRESNANRSDPMNSIYTVGKAPTQIKEALQAKGMVYQHETVIPGVMTKTDIMTDNFANKILSSSS